MVGDALQAVELVLALGAVHVLAPGVVLEHDSPACVGSIIQHVGVLNEPTARDVSGVGEARLVLGEYLGQQVSVVIVQYAVLALVVPISLDVLMVYHVYYVGDLRLHEMLFIVTLDGFSAVIEQAFIAIQEPFPLVYVWVGLARAWLFPVPRLMTYRYLRLG